MRCYLKSNRKLVLLASLLVLLVTQLALLGHVVLADHDQTVSCEVCLKSHQAEPQLTSATLIWVSLLLSFLVVKFSPPALRSQVTLRAYRSRAPPVLA